MIGRRARLGLAAAAAALFTCLAAPATMTAEVPPDILDSYQIAIAPRSDGTLAIDYTLTGYHPTSEWPSDQPYLQIGIPNGYFSLTGWEAKGATVSSVSALTGTPSFAQFNFGSLPRVGDSFDLRFSVSLSHMAFSNGTETSFEFIPSGWTFPITVRHMTVTWTDTSNSSLVRSVQPSPATTGSTMSWSWDDPRSDSSGMFRNSTIQIAYDQSAFSLKETGMPPVEYTPSDNGQSSSGSDPFGAIVAFLGVVGAIASFFIKAASGDGYSGGSGFHTGGGSFSGGGGISHSCACACAGCACACACACAGGGKVGCSRKAIGIACLPKLLRPAE